MYKATMPGFAVWLMRRGVPTGAAHRAAYLNRNITEKQADQLGADNGKTFSQQAAHALALSFDFRDTREGESYWIELCNKLKVEQ